MNKLLILVFLIIGIFGTYNANANEAENYCQKAIKEMRQAGIKINVSQCIYIK